MKLDDSQNWDLAKHIMKVCKLERAQRARGGVGGGAENQQVCKSAPAPSSSVGQSQRLVLEARAERNRAGAQLVAQSRPGGRDVPTAQNAFI